MARQDRERRLTGAVSDLHAATARNSLAEPPHRLARGTPALGPVPPDLDRLPLVKQRACTLRALRGKGGPTGSWAPQTELVRLRQAAPTYTSGRQHKARGGDSQSEAALLPFCEVPCPEAWPQREDGL
eukprot:14021153-Alexandrium_andersonii.AAC.1